MRIFEPHTPSDQAIEQLKNESLFRQDEQPKAITHLRPQEIIRAVSVFQPRSLDGNLLADEAHIRVLEEAIGDPKGPRHLDPILVWWSGKKWYVIDGFHRLEAYKRAKVTTPIPVEIFEGNLEQAMAAASAANSKDKLPMTKEDKKNMAWRLVRFTKGLSKSEIAKACAISERTVANMRSTMKTLLETGEQQAGDLPDSWREARREAAGTTLEHVDWDELTRKDAERMSKAIARSLGQQIHQKPEAFALALKLCDERLPQRLMETQAWEDDLRKQAELLEIRDAEECEYSSREAPSFDPNADY